MKPFIRPPGPRNRGMIGNFPLGSTDPLGVYTRWARQYGDIFYYRVFSRHIYFLNHPDLIEHVLVTNYQSFIKGEALQSNRRIFGNGLLTNDGDSWLQQRHLIQPAFHRDRIESYGDTMVAYTERMMAAWHDGEVRDIHRDMMRLALEIVAKVLFNVEVTADTDRIAGALNTFMELGSRGRMLLPPILRLLPTADNFRYRRAARQLDDIVYGLIHRRRLDVEIADDLLSGLLQAQAIGRRAMSDEQLRDEVMTLLLAGHETTAVSLSWTWYLLAQYPEVEKKLWSELRAVLNGRSPRVQDLSRLPYTERVVKEAMRLYPPAWAIVRNSLKDSDLGGYRVPAGATVMMSQWVMHRDPRYYDQPEQFNPDRWLEGRAKGASKFTYFPFGGGPRTCIGASFATMEGVLVLAAIAQSYQVRVVQDCPVEPLPTITLRPRRGIKVVLTRRVENPTV
ncbi:MAG: cytochrome P450 [Candidatus Sulfotelmatobacter sp.]